MRLLSPKASNTRAVIVLRAVYCSAVQYTTGEKRAKVGTLQYTSSSGSVLTDRTHTRQILSQLTREAPVACYTDTLCYGFTTHTRRRRAHKQMRCAVLLYKKIGDFPQLATQRVRSSRIGNQILYAPLLVLPPPPFSIFIPNSETNNLHIAKAICCSTC